MQIYGKGPVAVMPDDAAGREIHPLFFMHLLVGILCFLECPSLASYSGHCKLLRMGILGLIGCPFMDSFSAGFSEVTDDQPDLSGCKETLGGRIAAQKQFFMQFFTTDDPTAQAIACLVRCQLREVETGEV